MLAWFLSGLTAYAVLLFHPLHIGPAKSINAVPDVYGNVTVDSRNNAISTTGKPIATLWQGTESGLPDVNHTTFFTISKGGVVEWNVSIVLPKGGGNVLMVFLTTRLCHALQCHKDECDGGGDLLISVNDMPLPEFGLGSVPLAYYVAVNIKQPKEGFDKSEYY